IRRYTLHSISTYNAPVLSPSFFFLITPLPPRSTLFPYTTLFRSQFHSASRVPSRTHLIIGCHWWLVHQCPSPFSCPITCRLRLRSEEHTSELQSRFDLVCRLLLEKKKNIEILSCLRSLP